MNFKELLAIAQLNTIVHSSVNLARVLRHLTYWGFSVHLLACVCGLSMFSVFIRSCEVNLSCPHLSCLSLFFLAVS